MLLQYRKPYNSIRVLDDTELPNFVVLTGINGAGKSHLLQAINLGHIAVDGNVNSQSNLMRLFDANSLVPNGAETFDRTQSRVEREGLWSSLLNLRLQATNSCLASLAHLKRFDGMTFTQIARLPDSIDIGTDDEKTRYQQEVLAAKQTIKSFDDTSFNQFVGQDPMNRAHLAETLRQNLANTPVLDWSQDEFTENLPPSWTTVDVFQQSFARLFTVYADTHERNKYRRYLNTEGEKYFVLTEEEFVTKHGIPPWDFLNSVLATAGLSYRITKPVEVFDKSYTPVLKDVDRGIEIDFSSLSSGEKVIMSFALCLYHAKDNRQLVRYPQVMLFDEIDAPLHPSMTASLIRTIEEVLVRDRGIKVILTTHSPSTVALAPSSSIYVMNKAGRNRVVKATKDEALSVLLNGVPSLSLDYDNRRQVFVESDYDVIFYDTLYQLLRPTLKHPVSLSFMSVGTAKGGGCDMLIKIVDQLVEAGNKKVFGIVDWDAKHVETQFVKVLGEGKRYTIENYLLDPLFIAALLEHQKAVPKTSLGLRDDENYMAFGSAPSSRLQIAADFVIDEVRKNLPTTQDNTVSRCTYADGREIDIPNWFLRYQGHDLEAVIKGTFTGLIRFHRSNDLKHGVIRHVLADMPCLIPNCFTDLFRRIQA